MVWYASVKNGFDYAPFWDASTKEDSINGYKAAYKLFKAANEKIRLLETENWTANKGRVNFQRPNSNSLTGG